MLAAVRVLNWLERVGETLRATLNSLAVVAPEWIQSVIPAVWYECYDGQRVENDHLPKAEAARQERAVIIGADGQHLLDAINAATDQPWLVAVPAAQRLRQVWAEQYIKDGAQLR